MKAHELPADIRREKKLLLDDVAARMGTARSHASDFEAGKGSTTEQRIRKWAKAVGVPYARAHRAIWRAVLRQCRARMREAQSRLTQPLGENGA